MRTKSAMVCCGVVLLLCAALAAAQDCLEPVGSWPYGWSSDVAADGSMAVMGNGAVIQILDVGIAAAPVVLGEVRVADLVDAVAISGDRAFAATHRAMFVIDISAPTSPFILGELPISKTVDAIEVVADQVFLAGGDLDIVDVSTPSTPTLIGSWTELDTRDVVVNGSHAVVTASYEGLRVLDVSDPTAPTVVGLLTFGPDRRAQRVDLAGDHAIVLGYDNSIPGSRLFSVDLSNPAQPTLVAEEAGGGVDIEIEDDLVLVAVSGGVMVWDLTDPADPVFQGSLGYPNRSSSGIAAVGGYALVSLQRYGLAVISTSVPTAPELVGELDTPGRSMGTARAGDLLVVAAEQRGLRFVDLADPATPVELGHLDVEFMIPMDVVVDGNLVYTTGYGGTGFAVVDVSEPAAPTVIASLPGMWGGEIIEFANGLAFVACSDPGLRIVDVSVPAAPVQVGALDTQGTTWEYMAVSGELDLVVLVDVANDCSAIVVDVGNPAAPTAVSTIDLGPAGGAAFSGRYLLIGDLPLRIFDMSNPAVPVEQDPYDPWGAPVWFGSLEVAGSVAYAHLITPSFEPFVVAVDVGNPRAPANLGSAPLVTAGNRMSTGRGGVIVSADNTGFEHFALCRGPLFADGFESEDTSAWSGVLP